MRLKKSCKENLKEAGNYIMSLHYLMHTSLLIPCFEEYWSEVSKKNQPSLLGFLRYRKGKVDILDKDYEVSRYLEDIKCIKTHYNYNNKHIYDIVQDIENDIKDEEISSEVMEFWVSQGSSSSNENEGEEGEEGSECNNISVKECGSKALVCDILKDIISASQAEKDVLDIYSSKFSHSSIMDLRLGSEFSISLDQNLQDRVLHEVFDEIDDYITDEVHNYLTDFFNADRGHQGWCEVARSIVICEEDSEQLKDTKGLLKDTFGRFIKAFSLGPLNPLRNISTLERPHLNQFVHPMIDSSLWIFAGINYISGEIPLQGKIKSNADGIGFLNDVSDYQIACVEGAKPGARKKKIIDDDTKNIRNMMQLFNNIIVSEATERRQIYTDLRTYGAVAYKTEVSLTMMDFRGVYRLFEVDRFSLPKDWVDIPNFVFLYEALIKWALCARHTREGLIAQRKKGRIGRYSEARIVKKLHCLK
ncbi:hypothetical protein RclHR1_20820001 [Rhizophagus clarus]|uniref:Uncharacterized protein n=1 Tax=Rhizophagus clarus TaxID=94130 RepID=A0A2Z6RKS8_9GLOM|nr:hypothetical protein RclHR1_20820001 [Rhizophagus clarus]GES97319.1 hypothetical protein GLOIN_2v1646421 [Rhizophagus clarus]